MSIDRGGQTNQYPNEVPRSPDRYRLTAHAFHQLKSRPVAKKYYQTTIRHGTHIPNETRTGWDYNDNEGWTFLYNTRGVDIHVKCHIGEQLQPQIATVYASIINYERALNEWDDQWVVDNQRERLKKILQSANNNPNKRIPNAPLISMTVPPTAYYGHKIESGQGEPTLRCRECGRRFETLIQLEDTESNCFTKLREPVTSQ